MKATIIATNDKPIKIFTNVLPFLDVMYTPNRNQPNIAINAANVINIFHYLLLSYELILP